jgi:hypothetical protein
MALSTAFLCRSWNVVDPRKIIGRIRGMKTVVSVVAVLAYAFSSHAQLAITRVVDPVRTVIAAFDRVNLVGLGERHGALEDSQFRLRLIRDPEFSSFIFFATARERS